MTSDRTGNYEGPDRALTTNETTNPELPRDPFSSSRKFSPEAANAFLSCAAFSTDERVHQFVSVKVDAADLVLPKFTDQFVRLDQKDKEAEEKLEKDTMAAAKEGDFKKAEATAKKLLELREANYGKESAKVSMTLNMLASVCADDGRFKDAKEYHTRGAAVSKAAFKDKDNLLTALHVAGGAEMDAKLGNLKDAAAGFKEAVRIYDKHDIAKLDLGSAGIKRVALAYSGYADVLGQLGDKDEAKKQSDKAKKILELADDKPPQKKD
jgi:tetratricopeptide (TPR) repeat protein